MNTVQRTILDQLRALNPFYLADYEIKDIVTIGENTVRLCMRGREHVNADITFDRGQDLYNVSAHRLRNHGLDLKKIYEIEGIFWEQLDETLKLVVETASSELFG